MCDWELGEIASCHAMIREGIAIAKELNDKNSLAIALNFGAQLAANEGHSTEADGLASDLTELSTRYNFVYWGALGAIYRGWAHGASDFVGETRDFVGETRGGHVRGISKAKRECLRRTWIPTTSLVTGRKQS